MRDYIEPIIRYRIDLNHKKKFNIFDNESNKFIFVDIENSNDATMILDYLNKKNKHNIQKYYAINDVNQIIIYRIEGCINGNTFIEVLDDIEYLRKDLKYGSNLSTDLDFLKECKIKQYKNKINNIKKRIREEIKDNVSKIKDLKKLINDINNFDDKYIVNEN